MKITPASFIFWPVGNGDSVTCAIDDDIFAQIDLNHLECAGEDDDPHAPIVDQLLELLPKKANKPCLSAFILTHPDEDHCRGFKNLLSKAKIGEIWFSPRIFLEYKKDLCDDAQAFRDEAKRRVKKVIECGNQTASGDRVRIIGYSDLLKEEEYEGFSEEFLTIPGNTVAKLDNANCESLFQAFIHAPFKDDADGERNETSLAFQITMVNGEAQVRGLFFGDLSYPILNRIFEQSDAENLYWEILLAPHHCSKSAMYWKDEGADEETLRKDILEAIEDTMVGDGVIVASCEPIPSSNKTGDNPPHAIAKGHYEKIAPGKFICTQEHPNTKKPEPLIIGVDSFGGDNRTASKGTALAAAVPEARGVKSPPQDRVGFGQ